ncbi:E3 ubiquitin-protein ligase znrf2 [Gadus chalcogrammus]|uniref:E3 ubiquitin-protein ligase znrf2 n=1 Tax=Gadus chalcogrammus TaxID=1042646 RepID=UPI0024C3E457|nr:E3 ubiquitin-protein ligase znrf2 [Gadus chalcogrammus]XP_056449065.1 E3 ubiquitin-protein ligase znrf2 [Gadus chalcogrammus]
MGAKQSGPATNGRTRAYSGSDLPSNTSSGHSRAAAALGTRYHAYSGTPSAHHGTHGALGATSSGASPQHNGPSSRSSGGGRSTGASATRTQSGINIPNSRGGAHRSHESAGSTPDETAGERERSNGGHGGPRLLVGSLPAHLSPHLFGGFQCPVCSKFVSTDEMDLHLVMCLTKPRITYNEDVLNKAAGECAICLDDLTQGETIARLPCLCIYHKGCIDEWFEVNRSCPEHPSE